MQICGECQTPNNDGESFCANCHAYLVWPGEQEKPSKNAKAGPEADPGDRKTVLMPKVPAPPDHGPASQRGTRMDQPSSVPRVTRLPGTFPEEEAVGVIRAEKPLKPVTVDSTEPPPEVKPGRRTTPLETAPPPPSDETPPAPGELICGRCGTGNSRERHYCRRCAASLHEAAVVPPLPWWRRLGRPRPKTPLPAGTRPKRKRRHFPVRLVSFLAVLAVLGGAAYAGREAIAKTIGEAQDNLLGAEVHAQGMIASTELEGRAAKLAIDGSGVKSWSAAVPADSTEVWLEAQFEKRFRLLYVFISAGASIDPEVFRMERRPAKVEIITKGPDDEQISATILALQDVSALQRFYVGADGVEKVKIRILESTGPPDSPVAVAEVQFFGR